MVIGTVAVGQRTATQQLFHALGPPALRGLGLGQQIADRLTASDEHQLLTHQPGLKHIPELRKARAGEIRITEERQRLEQPGHRAGAGKRRRLSCCTHDSERPAEEH